MGEFQSFIGVDFWTALFTLLNFLAVFLVGRRYLWGPVMKIIQDRQDEIDGMYSDADTARASALDMENACKEKLAGAMETGERIVRDAVARGQSREEEIVRRAKDEAAAIRDKAAKDIAMERKKALNDAKNEISGLAMAIAGKVVARELTGADQTRLIDSFIDGLGDGL